MRTSNETRPIQRRRTRRRKTNRYVVLAALTLLLVMASLAGWTTWKYTRISNNVKLDRVQSEQVRAVLDKPSKPQRAQPAQFILFLGGDMRPGQTTGRADTIMIARVDPTKRDVGMLSIPRDSRVAIPGHGVTKINAALALGGPALAIKTVKAYTGLPINHFVLINFRGFADIVDSMGGVELYVDRAIDDENGATTGGVSNVTRIAEGRQRLDGRQALTYVRSRQFADGDFTRIRHQQTFLMALATQALSAENVEKLPAVAEVASDNMKTDMDIVAMSGLARLLKNIGQENLRGVTLPGTPRTIGGVSYVVPDLAAKKRIVAAFRRGEVAEESVGR